MSRRQHQHDSRILAYWPHAGLAIGVVLNVVGLLTGRSDLIGTGANVLTICGLFLVQRRRNDQRDD